MTVVLASGCLPFLTEEPNEAVELLRTTSLNISEICWQVGMSSPVCFGDCFVVVADFVSDSVAEQLIHCPEASRQDDAAVCKVCKYAKEEVFL